jgi:hypothetical protein
MVDDTKAIKAPQEITEEEYYYDSLLEASGEWQKEILDKLDKATKVGLNNPRWANQNFYVIWNRKRELLSEKRPNGFFMAIPVLPTPNWDCALWKYNREKEELEFLYEIPHQRDYYWLLAHNFHELDAVQQERYKVCHLIETGELLNWIKKENKEDYLVNNTYLRTVH